MNDCDWTIIIPVKPGGSVRALEPLTRLDYPRDRYEIIVAEGTRPSSQRNRAAEAASGKFLYFLDDDSLVGPDLLQRAAAHFADAHVAAVGGPSLTPLTDTRMQQAFGAALASFIGGGMVRNRYRKNGSARITGDHELILCNLSFRRALFLASGGLDERLYPNEENELMDRLRQEGGLLIHDPGLAVERSQRSSYAAFARQLFTYGRGRAEQTLISRRLSPMSLIPAIFLIYLLLVPLLHKPVYTLPLLCYAGAVTLTAVWEAVSRRSPSLLFLLPLLLPTLHLAYGAGMILGIITPRFRNNGTTASKVTLRRVEV